MVTTMRAQETRAGGRWRMREREQAQPEPELARLPVAVAAATVSAVPCFRVPFIELLSAQSIQVLCSQHFRVNGLHR